MAIKRYKNPAKIVESGYRRATKTELKRLGYSLNSRLYTSSKTKNPNRFFTRTELEKETNKFELENRYKIKATTRELYRYKYEIYKDEFAGLNLSDCISLSKKFIKFLSNIHKPKSLDQIGIIYIGGINGFSKQPVLWRDRETIISYLNKIKNQYTVRITIFEIIGWIEQNK